MKKTAFLFILLSVLLISGCAQSSPVNQNAKNGNGTPAVNVTDKADYSSASDGTVSEGSNSSGDVIEIKEKMFITQTNDIFYNAEEYLGKTIKYEGIFDVYESPETGKKYYSVIRYGPGCCGTDGNAGFEVVWDKEYPNKNDWVEVQGILEIYKENDFKYLRLKLSSLKVLDKRGSEYVYQ